MYLKRLVAMAATALGLIGLLAGYGALPAAASTSGLPLPVFSGTGPVPAGEPNTQHAGKVTIAILSPGDTHDGSYYESMVTAADAAAKKYGWKVIVVDNVAATNAVAEADDLCRQHVDMLAIGASELEDALPAAMSPECKNVFFYINGGVGTTQKPYFTQSLDNGIQSGYASGVATGMYMRDHKLTKAGFLAGDDAAFNSEVYETWAAGIKSVVPSATTVATYTGNENDSSDAVVAYNAQAAQGIQLVYPYFGGPTIPVAKEANAAHIAVVGGTINYCSSTAAKFVISAIFSPGAYFAPMLTLFGEGKLQLGVTRNWRIGIDSLPTVKFCGSGAQVHKDAAALLQVEHKIGTGKLSLAKFSQGS